MSTNKLLLKNIRIDSFAGISKSQPILLSFPEDARALKLEGDQGTRKTSTLDALKALLSANIVGNAISSIDDTRNAVSRFVGRDGQLYESKITKTTFVIENIITDDQGNPLLDAKGKERKREERKPVTLIKELVGPLGMSPLELKSLDPNEQITWIQSFSSKSETDIKLAENAIRARAKLAYDKRTKVNGEVKRLRAVVDQSDFSINAEEWKEKFKKIDQEQSILDQIAEKSIVSDQYVRAQTKVDNVKEAVQLVEIEITAIEAEILRLQTHLESKKTQLEDAKLVLTNGEKFLEDNKAVGDEKKQLDDELKEINELKVSKVSFDAIASSKEELDKNILESENLTKTYKEAKSELEVFIKSFVPVIVGLEVLVPTEEDDREGIYFRNKSIAQLCESELWEMCLLLWDAFEVRIVLVENINGLGSNAIERLNWFVEQGGYVFATEMDRAEKNIKVSINTKIN